MNELRVIIEAYERWRQEGPGLALATVVNVQGSAYRRPGARMLVTASGRRVGAISAGCLEQDICGRTPAVLGSREPLLARYDTGSSQDLVWGLGLGCNGVVEVLIEPLESEPCDPHVQFMAACLDRNEAGAIGTVFRERGTATAQIGSRVFLDQGGRSKGSMEPVLAQRVAQDLRAALPEGLSRVQAYLLPGGSAEVLLEVIRPPVSLVIFGAGPDAAPLARLAHQIGWRVTVVDGRPALVTAERFPWADSLVVSPSARAAEQAYLDARSACVLMTHNYLQDLDLLRTLLPSPACYLGVLGPRPRTEALLRELGAGASVEAAPGRLHTPIGLDIGAETPEEIALAIVAEIQAVLCGRSAGFLKDRRGPIHRRATGRDVAGHGAEPGSRVAAGSEAGGRR